MNVACARIGAVCLATFWLLGIGCPAAWAVDTAPAAIRIESPVAWQVVQRRTAASGSVVVCGTMTAGQGGCGRAVSEVRSRGRGLAGYPPGN